MWWEYGGSFIQVPETIVGVFSDLAGNCGAQLRHTYEQFKHRAGDVPLFRGEEGEKERWLAGVSECLAGAVEEVSTIRQEELLRAAQFGKCFLDGVSPAGDEALVGKFAEVSRTLRVLNSLRSPAVSMFLTYREFQSLGIPAVIRHLCERRFFYLAIKICDYLGVSSEEVLVSWSREKIRRGVGNSDEICRDQLRENLKPFPRVSYKAIAEEAFHCGRKRLATMLLEFEPSMGDRVSVSFPRLSTDRPVGGDGGVSVGVACGDE